jgi:outer membrane protein assembly factor BamB
MPSHTGHAGPIFKEAWSKMSGLSSRALKYLMYAGVCLLVTSCSLTRVKVKLEDPSLEHSWSQVRNNSANTGFVDGPAEIPDQLVWEAKAGGDIRDEPVADRGVIVAPGRDGRMYFFNAETGKRLARPDFKGVPTSPAFSGDSLAFGLDGRKSKFVVWDVPRQVARWDIRFDRPAGPPLLVGDHWLVSTYPGGLYKLDDGGEPIWSHRFDAPLIAKPAIADGRLYVVTGGKNVTCLELDSGTVIWDHSSAGAHAAAPAVDELVYFGSLDSNFYALSLQTGEMQWFFHTGGQIFTSPAVDRQRVYFGSNDGIFYALDKKTGRLVWKLAAGLVHNSSPAVWGSVVLFGTSDGRVLFVDVENGAILREFTTRGSIYSSPIVYDHKVYIADDRRRLYCFGPAEISP